MSNDNIVHDPQAMGQKPYGAGLRILAKIIARNLSAAYSARSKNGHSKETTPEPQEVDDKNIS